MIGIEPNSYTSLEVIEKLKGKSILGLLAGNKKQYVRILPSLNVKKEEALMFVDVMQEISSSI